MELRLPIECEVLGKPLTVLACSMLLKSDGDETGFGLSIVISKLGVLLGGVASGGRGTIGHIMDGCWGAGPGGR
jgi:hypothetical protein